MPGHNHCDETPGRARISHIDACTWPCTDCPTPTPAPTPACDPNAFASCDSSFGTCGWKDQCGGGHDGWSPAGWCCRRVCSGPNCITISSGLDQPNDCDNNSQCCASTAPDVPSLVSPAHDATITDTSVTVTWNAISNWGNQCGDGTGNDVYRVYLDTNPSPTTQRCVVSSGSPTTCSVSGLSDQTTYYWKVRADSGVRQTDSTTRAFTINLTANPWWQSQDGDVHAQGFINTDIPQTCTSPGCQPYGSKDGSGGYPGVGSAGASASFGDGSVSTQGWLANTSLPLTCGKYGYQGFYIRAGEPTSPAFTGALPGSSGVYFAGSNQTISSAWTLAAGRSLVIFVDGNLAVNASIDVPVGSFLALIVSGNITFGPTVSAAEGIFVADGAITTAASSTGFTGEGVFVGCGGFSLNRDFGDATNNTTPAEDFVWRPDLIVELLDTILVREPLLWQEVAP